MVRSSHFQVFYKIGILKKFVKFTRKHQCWSHLLIKSPEIKRLQHRCFPVNYAKLLRTPFLRNIPGGVGVCLRKSFTLQAFTERCLNGYLQANYYLRAKTICTLLVLPFLISPFSLYPVFSTNEVFEHLSMEKGSFNQIIRKQPSKGVSVNLLEKYLSINAGL